MAERSSKSPQPPMQPKNPRSTGSTIMYIVYAVIILGLGSMLIAGNGSESREIDWQRLCYIIENEDYEKIIVVNEEYAEIYISDKGVRRDSSYNNLYGRTFTGQRTTERGHYRYNSVGSLEHFDKELDRIEQNTGKHVNYAIEKRANAWRDLIIMFGPFLLLILLFVWMGRSTQRQMGAGGGGIFGVGRSRAKMYDGKTPTNTTFKDVAGLAGAKEEVMEVVDFLKNPKRYTNLGGKIPKGVLLVGPPGTGKTLLAKTVAGEANVPFFSLSGSDFVEMFVGVGASRVRDLFEEAKKKAPCIIFIDEIDAVGRARGHSGLSNANDERENTLNQLLTEMDGFSSGTNIIVMAATNRADVLDKALLRAGRFDRQIYVELPDIEERKAIFKVHMKGLKICKEGENRIDRDFLAKQTPGFSGADIANVCNEAALVAARKNKSKIEKQDFLDAIDRIVGGLEKRTKVLSETEKRTIAYHESGHASVSWLLRWASPLVKVTIVPRGKALGAAWYLPEERQITTFEQMFDEMTSLMAGRAAEDVVFGKISTGALNDIERATKMAFSMVAYYGMSSEVGNISYYDSTGQSDYGFTKPFSEKTNEKIDQEVRRLVEEAYHRARTMITEHRYQLEQLALKLYEKEVLFREDLERIYGPRPWEESSRETLSRGKSQPQISEISDKEDDATNANSDNDTSASSNNTDNATESDSSKGQSPISQTTDI
ncbi:MAG: ATP-dependent zinc metalloprotease FtsH [Bacteroidales bacterium]|nr:ATP-dependent zinc metalloprotease FtsH [Bacteroidales bacterium]